MTLLDRPSHFDDLDAPQGGEIVAVANAATAAADHDPEHGDLVIVARTARGEYRAVGAQGGPLRAAVSVAVASGSDRLWADAAGTATVELPVRALPEIVRSAAEARRVSSVHVGAIVDETVAAVAVWFGIDGKATSTTSRSETMELLATAAERQREFFAAERARQDAERPVLDPVDPNVRVFDPSDPNLDGITGLATRERFETAMEDYDSDEATLVVVDLDGFAKVAAEFGETIADAILRETADRLVSSCRRDDLIARIGPDTFAILFADAPRSVGLQVAKRLLDTIALPLPVAGGPEHVTATIALAHQFGLVDMDELLESADDAVASGKRSGTGRLVIAS